MNLEQQIEAVLFWKGEAVTIAWLAKSLGVSAEEIAAGLSALEASLGERGIRLVRFEDEVALTTAPKASELIEKLTREELSRDLGKAGLETLSIILYRGPIARRDIDYIRGVNSQFVVRNLLVRGLVERVPNPKDERSFLYKPTMDLLQHLGLEKLEMLPEFEKVRAEIEAWNAARQDESQKESSSELHGTPAEPERSDAGPSAEFSGESESES